MRALDMYPLVTAPDIAAVKAFYMAHFAAEVVFEANWFVMLSLPGADEARRFTLAFMTPDHPSRPPGPEPFDGKGMILTLQVENADAASAALQSSGASIDYAVTTEPWGQRRFMTRDPAGVLIDVVEQVAPQDGWWDRYMT